MRILGFLALMFQFSAQSAECPCEERAREIFTGDRKSMEVAKCRLKATTAECSKREEAYKTIETLAKRGDAEALYILGYWYMTGAMNLKVDYKMSFEHLSQAAEKKFPPTYYDLGWLYETGNGVVKDLDEAEKNYKKAKEGGDVRGQLGLKRIELERLKQTVGGDS